MSANIISAHIFIVAGLFKKKFKRRNTLTDVRTANVSGVFLYNYGRVICKFHTKSGTVEINE